MSIVYLNGQYLPLEEAKVSVIDRGFLFGDGIFEAIKIYHGKLFQWKKHIARLEYCLNEISLQLDITQPEWKNIFTNLIERNNALKQDSTIYLQITRGEDKTRRYTFPDPPVKPTIFALLIPIKRFDYEKKNKFSAITREDVRWKSGHIKSISRLPTVLLYQEAKMADANEIIFIRDGYAVEGGSSNLFIVKNNQIITPPETTYILMGITRELILTLAKKHNIIYQEKNILPSELMAADEVWITSSNREIMPITVIDGKSIGTGMPGSVWKKMLTYFRKFTESL